MPKPTALRRILQSELELAKQGLAYYQERVNMLNEALREVDAQPDTGQGKSRKAVKARKTQGNGLPETGLEFWRKHITKNARTAPEIALSAAGSLNIDPQNDKASFKVLKNRIGPALQALVKASEIMDRGAGRNRRYFKK